MPRYRNAARCRPPQWTRSSSGILRSTQSLAERTHQYLLYNKHESAGSRVRVRREISGPGGSSAAVCNGDRSGDRKSLRHRLRTLSPVPRRPAVAGVRQVDGVAGAAAAGAAGPGVLDIGGGPGAYAAPLARRGYRVHVVDPVLLHVEQARQAAGADPAARFTAALGDARELAEPDESQDAVLLFGPLYHLTEAAHRQQALTQARRVLAPAGRLLAMAVCRFASLLDGLYQDWLDDPVFRPIVDQDLADGQHRNPDPVGRPEFFTTAYFHTPQGLAEEVRQAEFTGVTVYGVEGPGWPLRQQWADPRRREHILFAARSVETQPSLIGFSDHLIAAATKP
jgi:ubiquinone/menaquinone biosynthesis C-methylase UbiE